MDEPAAKKAKTGEGEKDNEANGTNKEELAPAEKEVDVEDDKSPKIKQAPVFHTQDTTMNVMPSAHGNVLVPLTDGGLQYLLAGARASVGVKSGRHVFEAKTIEVMNPADDPAARQRTSMPRCQLRIGVSLVGSSLFLGEDESSICFDSEGFLIHNKNQSSCSQKFGADSIVTLLLNLDNSSPNANTISLFKDGQRASRPQPLPEALQGKALFPTLTFKNVTVCYNFGTQHSPLPFKCRPIGEASQADVTIAPAPVVPKDGKHEVIFPVLLPDEGGYDWLDMFLEKNPHYTELSDRMILDWAEKSGLVKPGGYAAMTSHDKPEMGFGISVMDDGSIRRVLQAIAPVQPRSYVVMELKQNLVKDDRKEHLARWIVSDFKKQAMIVMGTPPLTFQKRSQDLFLKQKQEIALAEFQVKQELEKRQKLVMKKQRQLEKERKKALKQQHKAAAEAKRKMELERKRKEANAIGEEYAEGPEDEPPKDDDPDEEDEEEEEDEIMDGPPRVELTAEEKKSMFRKSPIPDMTSYNLNTSFMKFSVPEKDEGFDSISYEWYKADKCKDYVKQWVQEKKTTTRIEEIVPGEWFTTKWKEWQKILQSWHAKHNTYKAQVAQNAANKAAKQAKKAALAAAREARSKAAAAAKEKASADAAAKGDSSAPDKKPEESPAEEAPAEEEEEDDKDDGKIDFDKLDVFSVEDILDVGGGEPLFSTFGFEDWTMMSLRYEIHLLAHSFMRDVKDPDRIGIHLDHLTFYYSKYFKKALNVKYFGVETMHDLIDLIRDTAVVSRKVKVVETQLPDDLESLGIFVMLTEEARRDRLRRVDLGDESAKLKLHQPQVVGGVTASAALAAAMTVRPQGGCATRPSTMMGGAQQAIRPQGITPTWQQQQPGVRPVGSQSAIRPNMGSMGMNMNMMSSMMNSMMWRAPQQAWRG